MRGESARPGKRPLRALSATEKMEAIQRVHEGESKASVARDIGVPESTLRGWCKSEQKIRGMARNSSTPDSEAHSPASSSGGAKLASSEDESSPAVVAAAAKRGAKIQDTDQVQQQAVVAASLMADAANGLAPQHHQAATVDYINSLLQGLASNGLRPEAANALVLQQMSLIANATKNSVLAGLQPPAGLVPPPLNYSASENGLSRQKSPSNVPENLSTNSSNNAKNTSESLNNNSSNHNNNNSIITSISGKANRTTSTTTNSVANQNGKTSSNPLAAAAAKIRAVASASQNQSYDEDFWVWMAQQQQYGAPGYQYFDPKTPQEVSVFWNWYQETNRRYFGGPTQNGSQQSQLSQQMSPPTPPRQRSPSQVRANMDSVLSNGEAAAKNFHLTDTTAQIDALSTEEAIRYGELFFRWLDRCSDYPTITRLQIMQFKNMLENLKNHKNNKRPANSGLIPNHHTTKHSRK